MQALFMSPARINAKSPRPLLLLFSLPLIVCLLFFFASLLGEKYNDQVQNTQSFQNALLRLESLAKDAEAGERGYLLSGDERYLLPYQQARGDFSPNADALRTQVRDNAALRPFQEPTKRIINLAQETVDEAGKTISAARQDNSRPPIDRLSGGAAESRAEQLRLAVGVLEGQLSHDLQQQIRNQRILSTTVFILFLVATVVLIFVGFWLYNNLVSYMHDSRAAQAELEQLNAELEDRIAERTLDLSKANEELQQFAYVASHDLQEPIRTITSFTQLLANRYHGRLDQDADEFIDYIVSSSRRMTDLINGLLALIRLRKMALPRGPVSIEKLLRDAESSLQAAIRESNARVENTPLPFLAADPVQITQLFMNLIGNAIKYRRSADPIIKVSARRETEEWIFAVEDNGQGFEQQYAERIFGLFQRLHGREIQGTGMGLSIARKIVERHGGKMWAEGRIGVGSTFYFTLPNSLEPGRYQPASTAASRKSLLPENVL
jgi:signal transduction histidine kinase